MRARETRVMQNVLIVCEESAMLACRAPERIEEATGEIAKKAPNVHTGYETFIPGCFSVVESYSSLLTLHRLYSSLKISRRLYPTGFCILIREKENNYNKNAAMAITLSYFPPNLQFH